MILIALIICKCMCIYTHRHASTDFQDLWTTSSMLCFSLSCVACIEGLTISYLGAFCFSGIECHAY